MARPLERYTASGRIRTGPVFEGQSISAATAPYEALGSVANGLSVAANVLQQKQVEKDVAQATDLQSRFSREIDEWKEANKTREDFGEAYRDFADKRIAEIAKEANTGNAGKDFTYRARSVVDREYGSALQIGERNRFANFRSTTAGAAETAAASFRSRYQDDPQLARELVLFDLDTITASAETAFGGKSKALTEDIKRDAITSVILGVTEVDPAHAKELLNSYQVDEQTRQVLLNKIESAEKGNFAIARTQLNQLIEDEKANAAKGLKPAADIPLSQFIAATGNVESATAAKMEYDRERDKYNSVMVLSEEMKGKNIESLYSKVKSAFETEGEKGKVLFGVASNAYSKAIDKMMDDPADYVRSNPHVQRLNSLAAKAPANLKGMFTQRALDMQMEYMGVPPDGTPESEKAWYLGLRSDQMSVLSKGEASNWAARINSGKAQEAQQALIEFDQAYGKHRATAWRDLTRLPGGQKVSEEMQLAALIRFQPEFQQYVNSIKSVDAMKQMDPKTMKDLEDKLLLNENWKAFRNSFIGDNNQNADTVAGFQRGILAYAMSLPGKDVNKAVEALISRSFGYTNFNGQELAIPRYRDPGQPYRSDSEVKQIARDVKFNVANINPAAVGDFDFSLFSNTTGLERDAAKKVVLSSNSTMLVPSTDGQGLFLYVMGDTGIPTQIRDRKGNPIFYHFDDESKRNWPLSYEGTSKKKEVIRIQKLMEIKPEIQDSQYMFR